MSLLEALTNDLLRETFDPQTFQRGEAYAEDGRVGDPQLKEIGDTTLRAAAEVRGSTPVPYRVVLILETKDAAPRVMNTCTCPVRLNCKHGVALGLSLINPAPATAAASGIGPSWETELRTLLGQLAEDSKPEDDLPALALEIDVHSPRSAAAGAPTVELRPMRMGNRERWAKTGADWSNIASAVPGKDFPRGQLLPLQELARQLRSDRLLYARSSALGLSDFGEPAIGLLREAVRGGVTVLPGESVRDVVIFDDPLSLAGELHREEGEAVLRFGLAHGDRVYSGPTVLTVGRPIHSVGVLDAGVLHLGDLAGPLSTHAQRLVTAREPLTVPEAEIGTLSALLGPLARLVPLTSTDGALDIPEPPEPRLSLAVTWHSSTHASLGWTWAYGTRHYPVDSREDIGLVRDPAAETQLRALVSSELLRQREVRDGDALALAIHDLPALREIDGVDVSEVERPHFQETEEEPEISFEVEEQGSDGGAGQDWLDLKVVVSIGNESVPLADVLSSLTRGDDFLVLPSGTYISTDRTELDRLRNVVEAAGQLHQRSGDGISVGKHDLGVWAELAELGVVDQQAAEWVHRAQALRDLREIPRPEPTGVATDLRHYQLDGFHWLAFLHDQGLGGILADDMGLGKTLQVLATMSHAVANGTASDAPFLVVAPTSVVPAWVQEAARHTPGLRVATVSKRSDHVATAREDADIVITTYAILRLEQDAFAGRPWAGLVLDEAQQVKNHQSKTYAAARRIDARWRLAVTGTPFENRLMELWALLSITAPGLYPSPRMFRDTVVSPVEKSGDDGALRRFRTRLRPFLLRRTKELVADDLPPKQEQVLGVDLNPEHRKIYDAHLAKERQRILHLLDDFNDNRVAILSALTRLRQLSLDAGLVDPDDDEVGSAKLDTLVDHIEELAAEGHKALVFSQFTSFLDRARTRLTDAGIDAAYLDGATRDRGKVIESFRDGDAPVFLISLKAGGVGLTLTEADYVFVLDPWWNPAAEAQAVDRAHRIGQTQHVMVYRLVSTDTIEEKVMELKERKAELFAKVVDGEGAMSSAIGADDIRALFD
ncbi:DEAD/DEAH box helicase [Nocardioides albertanoniae]|uniref:DEAD/DEAH box helicase n=1 Tax=Nocardioides albertanoniae TaxID=1175486 RepID=UPI00114EDE57|nr:DEAD/DEAH box helicase [Nocardioides albertanoniae]